MKYYDLKKIKEYKADYNLIIGERSNGKTYALLKEIVKNFVENKKEGAYIRRWKDDIIGKRAESVFSALVENDEISKITKGEFTNVVYSRGCWYLSYFDETKHKYMANPQPFCRAFALSDVEHDKSTSYPNVDIIVFDEFITRMYYLPDEFVIFMNVLSTIIRDRNNVKIYMLANTVNKFCPYFDEMGLYNISTQEQGTIDIYSMGENLKIAVEYCGNKLIKKSNKYFAFNNPRLNMITGGAWEIALYKHLPQGTKIKPKNILYTFYIKFSSKIVGCDVVQIDDNIFVFCRSQTKEVSNSIVYTLDYTIDINTRKSFFNPIDKRDKYIRDLYMANRFFYQSNDIGEIVNNYIKQVQRG